MFRFEFGLSRDKFIHWMQLFSGDRGAKQLHFSFAITTIRRGVTHGERHK